MVPYERNSDLSELTANINNTPEDSVDCGIKKLGWCRGETCLKYARLRTFVVALAILGILQGACETYFRISAKQAAVENDYNPILVEWLLASSGLFQAIFALLYTHWANKLHPISWLGGTIMIQSATCIIAIIPSILNFSDGIVGASENLNTSLCTAHTSAAAMLSAQQSHILILVMLFILQLLLGLGSLAFYTVGLTYLDDNSLSIDSPAVIATAFGAKIFGLQVGSSLILGVGATSIGWWLGWAILAPLIFVSGFIISLFPKRLPKTVVHYAAQRILEESRSRRFGSQFTTYIDDVNFIPTLRRLFGNKLLMFNLIGIMFIQAALINFQFQEESYLQSRFYLPFNEEDGLMQEWKARFVSYFLKPPVTAIGMLIGGLVISKMQLSGRKIVAINIGLGLKLMLIFIAFIFIKCNVGAIAGISAGKLTQPYCSKQCICKPTTFLPICPENATSTYFSPCYAGCTIKTTINNIELYEGCSCGSDYDNHPNSNLRATEGSCSSKFCTGTLIGFEVLSILSAGLIGMILIGRVIITLRCVLPQDKSMALAMEVMFVGLFTYVPVHLAYDVVTRTTCIYWAPDYARCLLRETPKHGNILNILTSALIFVGVLFDFLVFYYAKDLNLYNCKVTDDNYTPTLYARLPKEEHELSPTQSSLQPQGGSPITTSTVASPIQQRDTKDNVVVSNQPHINVYRNPSSVTSGSSTGDQIIPPTDGGVTYTQVVFPPDKHKTDDGTTSPKRLVVRADIPVQHLSEQDVRAQLGNLKSFHGDGKVVTNEETPLKLDIETATKQPMETNLDLPKNSERPQSPETDF